MTAPCFEAVDPHFSRLLHAAVKLELLYTGCRWAEGPAYFPAGRYLIWSDIPNNRQLRYDECSGDIATFRQPSGHSNGNTVDREGRLISCEHLERRITRTEHNGRVVTLADHYAGMRFNSPNDVVVKSDGSIWFTDPTYGIDNDYEGLAAPSDIGASHVYRIDPSTGQVVVVANDFVQPNGLAFSPDERWLYIADTGRTHGAHHPAHIRKFSVDDDSRLHGGDVFAECVTGLFDGFRIDQDGRLWTSCAEGVHCYLPNGSLIGKILVPEIVSNVCFGGPRRNRLFICGATSLYSIFLFVAGAKTI